MATEKRKKRIASVITNRHPGIIVLEDIHDPHNAAAVFRTCDAFGFQQVYLIFEKEKKFNPRRVGKVSSASANKWLDFKIYSSTKKCIADLKRKKYEIVASTLNDSSENLFQAKFKSYKTALMFGNEHRGLSDAAIKLSHRQIIIPMFGMVQSLNLSVTAAICMYELTRQNQFSKNFQLTKKEQTELLNRFKKM